MNRNVGESHDSADQDAIAENRRSPSSNAIPSLKPELSSTLFQKGTSQSGLVRTESGRRGTFNGKDRLNASGNIVLKRHESEAHQQARLQRIHLKVLRHSSH